MWFVLVGVYTLQQQSIHQNTRQRELVSQTWGLLSFLLAINVLLLLLVFLVSMLCCLARGNPQPPQASLQSECCSGSRFVSSVPCPWK